MNRIHSGARSTSPKITLFIPTLNAMTGNKRLDVLFTSIAKQSYPNYEVIVVDGGSSDSTLAVCGKYAEVCRCFTMDGYISDATNFALSIATGEYIILLDADMYLPKDFLRACTKTVVATGADCLEIRNWYRAYRKPRVLNAAFMHEVEIGLGAGPVPISFYSLELIDGIRMPERLSFGEDFAFREKILERSPRIARGPEKLQHFFDPSLSWMVRRTIRYARMMRSDGGKISRSPLGFVISNSLFKYPRLREMETQELRARELVFFPTYLAIKYCSFALAYLTGTRDPRRKKNKAARPFLEQDLVERHANTRRLLAFFGKFTG